MLSRIIYGAQVSMQAGVVSVGFALVVGVVVGLAAGYRPGWLDDVLMRIMDALWSFPSLVLALAITAALGPGLTNAMIAIGIGFTPAIARLVRAQALSVRERDFVIAARVLGAGWGRLLWVHIWPNVTGPIVVQASVQIAFAIIIEASLSFLGLGVQPPQPSWGSMLRSAYQYMQIAPWLSLFPGFAIFVTVLGFNLLGDGLRRAPRSPAARPRRGLRAGLEGAKRLGHMAGIQYRHVESGRRFISATTGVSGDAPRTGTRLEFSTTTRRPLLGGSYARRRYTTPVGSSSTRMHPGLPSISERAWFGRMSRVCFTPMTYSAGVFCP